MFIYKMFKFDWWYCWLLIVNDSLFFEFCSMTTRKFDKLKNTDLRVIKPSWKVFRFQDSWTSSRYPRSGKKEGLLFAEMPFQFYQGRWATKGSARTPMIDDSHNRYLSPRLKPTNHIDYCDYDFGNYVLLLLKLDQAWLLLAIFDVATFS